MTNGQQAQKEHFKRIYKIVDNFFHKELRRLNKTY